MKTRREKLEYIYKVLRNECPHLKADEHPVISDYLWFLKSKTNHHIHIEIIGERAWIGTEGCIKFDLTKRYIKDQSDDTLTKCFSEIEFAMQGYYLR